MLQPPEGMNDFGNRPVAADVEQKTVYSPNTIRHPNARTQEYGH